MKKNFLVLIGSILLIISCLEILIRVFFPQELTSAFRVYGKDGLLLNEKNDKAIHQFRQKKVKYKFGDYHNRIYKFEKKDKKILILGDSFTFGWLLEDEDTYIYKLNKNFLDYNFINSAAGGWGTSDQLKYLKQFCNKIKPKYTIIFINFPDFARSKNSKLFYLDGNDNLISGKNEYMILEKLTEFKIYKLATEKSHFVNFLRKKISQLILIKKRKKILDENKRKIETNLDQFSSNNLNVNYNLEKKLFLELKNESEKCRTKLILINLGWENYETFEQIKFLKTGNKFFDKNKIIYIDLNKDMEVIRVNKKNYMIKYDGHPNELANQVIYKIVFDKLKNYIE